MNDVGNLKNIRCLIKKIIIFLLKNFDNIYYYHIQTSVMVRVYCKVSLKDFQ